MQEQRLAQCGIQQISLHTCMSFHLFNFSFSFSLFFSPSSSFSLTLSAREERYFHEFASDEDDEDDGGDSTNDTLQQSFANFNHVAPRFAQMMEEIQSSLSDENDPNSQHLRKKTVHILGEGPKHEHRDSGISGELSILLIFISLHSEWHVCTPQVVHSWICIQVRMQKSGSFLSAQLIFSPGQLSQKRADIISYCCALSFSQGSYLVLLDTAEGSH